MGNVPSVLANSFGPGCLRLLALIVGLVVFVAVAVGVVERRLDSRPAPPRSALLPILMGYRRPMPLRYQIFLLAVVVVAALFLLVR